MDKKQYLNYPLPKIALAVGIMLSASVGSMQASPVTSDTQQVATDAGSYATVSGKVVDEKNEPIVGASVVVNGTAKGTSTDLDGKFIIKGVSKGSTLQVSYVGYITEKVKVTSASVGTLQLRSTSENLDEVVVVGYGTQKKVNLTGAVQNVTSKELTRRSVTNASQALQGLAPGVSVTQSSGAPGSVASIQIRGTGSIYSTSSPLVLVDGIEGDMNSIDMNAIESISILKDAASAAIYGSKAANGVILVTTKRASGNTNAKVSYNGWVGFRNPTNLPDPTNAVEYMEAVNIARANDGLDAQYSQELIDEYKTNGADNVHRYDTRWRDEIFKYTALTQNHSVSVSGGNESVRSYVNASYNYEDGLVPNNNYNRLALRSNTDAKINNWISAGLNLNIRRTNETEPSVTSNTIIQEALTFTPVYGGKNADGTWANGQNGINPWAEAIDGGQLNYDYNDVDVKGTLTLTPVDGLTILGSYDTRKYEYKYYAFLDTYDTYEDGVYVMTYPATGNSRSETWYRMIRNQFNAQATYEKTFNQLHYFKGFLGFQSEEVKNRSMSAGRKDFNYEGYEELTNGSASTATASGTRSELAMVSYVGRLNYVYDSKYLFELTGRYDGSSRFTAKNRWGFFPAVSAGWRISEEGFFDSLREHVSNLKLRASYGVLGNQDLYSGYYPYAATLSSGASYWYDKSYTTGVYASQLSNADITWEKSKQFDVGVDATALNSRLNVTFDYYVRNISNMLQTFPAPLYVGLSSPWQNAGDMQNKGWDLSVSWRDKIGNVDYSVTAMLSDVKNEVTNLYGQSYINSNNSTQEGHPIYSWYGYVADGYFQSQEEIDDPNQAVYGGNKANVRPGYIKYKDISGPDGVPDGEINDYDRTFIGDPQNRYNFSVNLAAQWNGFDFNMFLQGVGKKDIYAEGRGLRPFYVGRTIYRNQLNAWSEDNRNAEFPLLLIDGTGTNMNNIPSSFWVKSGAYMRVKNVTIGYTLPKKLLAKAKLDNLRLYVSGQNMFTICKGYEGYDPECSAGSYYPLMRIYTFGVDLKF